MKELAGEASMKDRFNTGDYQDETSSREAGLIEGQFLFSKKKAFPVMGSAFFLLRMREFSSLAGPWSIVAFLCAWRGALLRGVPDVYCSRSNRGDAGCQCQHLLISTWKPLVLYPLS
jgi:hypothetical protein